MMNVTKAQVSKMERGLIRLNDEWLEKLSVLYNCSVHDLIDDSISQKSDIITAPIIGCVDAKQAGMVEEKFSGNIRCIKPKNSQMFDEYFSLSLKGELFGRYNDGDILIFADINEKNSNLLKHGSVILCQQKDHLGNPCGKFVREIEIDSSGLCYSIYKIKFGQKAFSKPVRELLMRRGEIEKYLAFEKMDEEVKIPVTTEGTDILGVLVKIVADV